MEKPVDAKQHTLIDHALAGCLLILPSLPGLNKTAKRIYAAEGLILLPYVALTKQAAAIKGLIPLATHRRIDPFNFAQFALLPFFRAFHKTQKALVFNTAFSAWAGLTVLFTDYKEN